MVPFSNIRLIRDSCLHAGNVKADGESREKKCVAGYGRRGIISGFRLRGPTKVELHTESNNRMVII